MTFKEYKFLISSDLYRIVGKVSLFSLVKYLLMGESFKYIFWLRTSHFFHDKIILRYTAFILSKLILRHYMYKFSISIPLETKIGSGFYIGHFGGIVVNSKAIIGKNCNLSQGVTIGQANRGKNKGCPRIGDNVYIGPGAKIVGSVKIGNNVAIGANCVVTKDVPNSAVIVGVPGKVISYEGSEGYINRVDYI